MGCCNSSPNDVISYSSISNPSSLTPLEAAQLEKILSQIPSHCRQEIINLPPRPLINAFAFHVIAVQQLREGEFQAASLLEIKAIQDLQILLANHHDHFIFADMHFFLGICLLALGNIQNAVDVIRITLAIRLKYTPTDYEMLSATYLKLSLAYKASNEWRKAAQCVAKAIEIARLRNDLDQEEIRRLEADLDLTKKRAHDDEPLFAVTKIEQNPTESSSEFLRRTMFENHNGNSELPRAPDKQTETEVNDDILKIVLASLEKHLNENMLRYLKIGVPEIVFMAEGFKRAQLKSSPVSVSVIEAALTMIADGLNGDDEKYASLKQSPFCLSYSDDSHIFGQRVRLFRVTAREGVNLNNN